MKVCSTQLCVNRSLHEERICTQEIGEHLIVADDTITESECGVSVCVCESVCVRECVCVLGTVEGYSGTIPSHAGGGSGALAYINCLWDTLMYTGFLSDNEGVDTSRCKKLKRACTQFLLKRLQLQAVDLAILVNSVPARSTIARTDRMF